MSASLDTNVHNHSHCSKCYNPSKCQYKKNCLIISCKNKCSFKYHECKSVEHLANTCPNEYVDCINYCNGCLLKIKRKELGIHLKVCPASVINCSSLRIRRLLNKYNKFSYLKWPCPIQTEKNNLTCTDVNDKKDNKNVNTNSIFLNQDYESLKLFSEVKPLRFSRLYGYLIGLDIGKDYSMTEFGFLRRLLKNVKSQIFNDIECENCIIFNDEDGCLACRARIRNLEMNRYYQMKAEHMEDFYSVLRNSPTYDSFIEERIYGKPEFLKIYEQFYFKKPKKCRPDVDLEIDNLNDKELNGKLIENNKEILKVIELNETLRLNECKEVPCDEFFVHSDAYKLKETTFTVQCNLMLRRDEFTDHYSLFHNYLLPCAEHIDMACPMTQYGCKYFERKSEFLYGSDDSHKYLNLKHPTANLVKNDVTKCLSFQIDHKDFEDLSIANRSQVIQFMELPFDVLFEIIDRLDSLSLYCLSVTCQELRNICAKFLMLRGIVYPKWSKKKNEMPEGFDPDLSDFGQENVFRPYRWEITTYASSFSKHIQIPTSIRLKKISELNMHLKNCPYKRVREHTHKFRIH